MSKVVIAYHEFADIVIEEEILTRAGAEVVQVNGTESDEARAAIREADALMVTIQPVPDDLITTMERCHIICRVGSGLDVINIPAATSRGIWVTNVPDYCIDEVATHTVALLLAQARRLAPLLRSTDRGEWNSKFVRPFHRLTEQTVGFVGFGRIGQLAAQKALGLGLKVVVHDPYIDDRIAEAHGVTSLSLDDLLREADYVSLHMPLTDETRHLMNARTFALMKPTAFLINSARGGLIDELALVEAVQTGQIAGAALDVLAVEPLDPAHPFVQEERIILTPHIAYYSEEASVEVRVKGAEDVVRVLQGGEPRSPANQIDSGSVE